MEIFKPTAKLDVWRTLQTGQRISVGTLAQNRRGVYFQYDPNYLRAYSNLSPFGLRSDNSVQVAPVSPHGGLHGVFADALPDGWGLLLQDRTFRKYGITPRQITPMDRLSFVGDGAIGALSFTPHSAMAKSNDSDDDNISLHTLGLQAQALFDGQTDKVLEALLAAGSSGGARPKAQVYFAETDSQTCSTHPRAEDDAWIVKFTSNNFALGHEEGLCEAAYLSMARQAGLAVPEWQLIQAPTQSGATAWLAIKRFDWLKPKKNNRAGRLHMQSACGLLDADFRSPSLDYEDLIKATSMICHSPAAGQLQFARMMFNLYACNHDDHSKNWALLQNDQNDWQPAPFYDVTFSPHPYGEHATAFKGFGKNPPLKTVQGLAVTASYSRFKLAQETIQRVLDALSEFEDTASQLGIKKSTQTLIRKHLNETFLSNKHLICSTT